MGPRIEAMKGLMKELMTFAVVKLPAAGVLGATEAVVFVDVIQIIDSGPLPPPVGLAIIVLRAEEVGVPETSSAAETTAEMLSSLSKTTAGDQTIALKKVLDGDTEKCSPKGLIRGGCSPTVTCSETESVTRIWGKSWGLVPCCWAWVVGVCLTTGRAEA